MDRLPEANVLHLHGEGGIGKFHAVELTGLRFQLLTHEMSLKDEVPLKPEEARWEDHDIIVIDEIWYWSHEGLGDALSSLAEAAQHHSKLLVVMCKRKEDFDHIRYQGQGSALNIYLRNAGDSEIFSPALKELSLRVASGVTC